MSAVRTARFLPWKLEDLRAFAGFILVWGMASPEHFLARAKVLDWRRSRGPQWAARKT